MKSFFKGLNVDGRVLSDTELTEMAKAYLEILEDGWKSPEMLEGFKRFASDPELKEVRYMFNLSTSQS
jgi:hypothetical protein